MSGCQVGLLEVWRVRWCGFFFFNDTATTEIYTLSLHDALPISARVSSRRKCNEELDWLPCASARRSRSEEHTSELQSQSNLVCRLLLEKKKMEYLSPAVRSPPSLAHSP